MRRSHQKPKSQSYRNEWTDMKGLIKLSEACSNFDWETISGLKKELEELGPLAPEDEVWAGTLDWIAAERGIANQLSKEDGGMQAQDGVKTNGKSLVTPQPNLRKAKATETSPLRGPPPEFLARLYRPALEGLEDPPTPTRTQSSSSLNKQKRTRDEYEHPSAPIERPTAKRKHASFPTPSPTNASSSSRSAYVRHESFYHLDGTLYVQLQGVRFNLHRSRLVKVSEWFQQRLDDAPVHQQRLGESERDPVVTSEGDGKLVVNLDQAMRSGSLVKLRLKDFEALLAAMDDAITYSHSPPPRSTVLSVLRASCALRVPSFQDWALRILSASDSDEEEEGITL